MKCCVLPRCLPACKPGGGPTVIGPDGEPDHERIAEIVFADSAEKRRLETLVHPLIAHLRAAMIEAVDDTSTIKAIVIDSPLLLESNLDRECTHNRIY